MCFVTRSYCDDTDVFVYCLDFGFHISLEKWLSFVKKFELECVNHHYSYEDPTIQYCIYVCSLDKFEEALSNFDSMVCD